jgi:hypothetical protein
MNPLEQPTPALAPTPRTDSFLEEINVRWDSMWFEFARTLERELTETERLRFGADADRRQLRCDLSDAKAEASHYMAVAQKATDELIFFRADNLKAHQMTCAAGLERDSLRAEVERLTTKIGNQADRIRYLEGAINHATGTPLSKAIARAEKAEADNAYWQKLLLMSRDDREIDLISEIEEQARLLGMSGEREADLLGKLGRLESELAAIKNGHGELGKYEQLRLKNAELHDIINRASTQFFHDGTDGETAAKMLTVLNEAK